VSFKAATRKRVKARLAFAGISKSGKSATALGVMRGIVGPTGRIAAVDTENGALSLYAGMYPTEAQPSGFDVQDLTNCSPDAYVKAIKEAGAAKYDGLIIDSVSQEWGSILEIVDGQVDKFFTGWKAATPKHNEFIRSIITAPMHVIATVRQKDEYHTEQRDGKTIPVKVGTEMVQRKQFEYEFNAVMTLDLEHNIRVTHSAISFMPNGTLIPAFPSMDGAIALGTDIRRWLDDGTEDWVPPEYKKVFYIPSAGNVQKEVISGGIEREQYIGIMNLGLAVDKVQKKGYSSTKIRDMFSKGVAELTQSEASAVMEVLQGELPNE